MTNQTSNKNLFPEFEKFVAKTNLLTKAKGSSLVKLHRILGKGKTKAKGLDLPPATIERKQELVGIGLTEIEIPKAVLQEINNVKDQIEKELSGLKTSEGVRRFTVHALKSIDAPHGQKNNHFYAGRFILVSTKNGQEWSWSLTKHYPIISKIPPDVDYLINAFSRAEQFIQELILTPDDFNDRLELSWAITRHFSESSDKVMIRDVANFFKVSAQDNKFWNNPRKSFFVDLPDAAFIANLMHAISSKTIGTKFEFVPATLHQQRNAFFFPQDAEGTLTKPMIYMKKR